MGETSILATATASAPPMQWSGDRNGGFSRAEPASLFLPQIIDPDLRVPSSKAPRHKPDPLRCLTEPRRMLAVRKPSSFFFGPGGAFKLLAPGNRKVLAYLPCAGPGRHRDALLPSNPHGNRPKPSSWNSRSSPGACRWT